MHIEEGTTVAIPKETETRPLTPHLRGMFFSEMKSMICFAHEHLYQVGIEFEEVPESTYFLLMEYLAG